MAKIIIYLYS